MTTKNVWWLAEISTFAALVSTIWSLDTFHFYSAILIASVFSYCYHRRRLEQDAAPVDSIGPDPVMTLERLAWLESCARESREAEERGKRCEHGVWLADHCWQCEYDQSRA